MNEKEITVSVIMLCYNQEKFIAEAIRSVIMQKADFRYELIIADDCSTDHTVQVCRKYQNRYPDKIKLFVNDSNCGLAVNFVKAFKHCRGEFIAICEGDDYWINKKKLQKQVDILRSNSEYALCFHRVLNYYEKNNSKSISNLKQKSVLSVYDLLVSNVITNVSVLYRNYFSAGLPSWMNEVPTYDYAMHIMTTMHGSAVFTPEVMAVYRIHDKGLWSDSGSEKRYLIALKIRELIMNHFNEHKEVCRILRNAYFANARNLIKHYQQTNNNEKATAMRKSIDNKFPLYSDKFELMLFAETSISVSSRLFRIVKFVRQEVSKLFPLPRIKDEVI